MRTLLPRAPWGSGALPGDGTASSAGAPISSQLPVPAPALPAHPPGHLHHKTLPLRSIPQHLHGIASPSWTSYWGIRPPEAKGAHRPSRPHTPPHHCPLLCISILKLVHKEECEQTRNPLGPLLPQIPPSAEEGLLVSRSSFSQLRIYLRIPAKEVTNVLEASHPPGFSPSAPQHLPPVPGGISSPCPRHSSSLLSRFSFTPDRRCLYLPACLSHCSFCSAFTGKKCFYRRKCNQIKREVESSTSKLARQAFSVQDQGPNSAFIAVEKNLDYLPLN